MFGRVKNYVAILMRKECDNKVLMGGWSKWETI